MRPELVRRSRLIKRLNESLPGQRDGFTRKLTLISAPAGYGKTMLVSDWIEHLQAENPKETRIKNKVAWLSLDEGDNNPTLFLTYIIAALQTIETDIGTGALNALESSQPTLSETTLKALINEIATLPDRIILVLDDYHLIVSQAVHDPLIFLIENQPPQLHLVIATREDPQLPLARMRALHQLNELRAVDLRFNFHEAAEFLNRVMGLNLSAEEIAALETRTEGWIAGLQLAALSLQGKDDTATLINSFTGSNRLVLDYLIQEVIVQQPENIQTFLLQTAILSRLSGSLCDALTDQNNGQETLEYLDLVNLFVVPLDNERRWYRFHLLFADLLRQRLHQTQPEQVPILHLKASKWYEQNGFTEQAIEHSLRAEDFNRAALLAELAWPEMHMSYKGVTWLRWVEAIPDELVRTRPILSTGYGWSLIDSGDLDSADLRLKDAERWLASKANTNEQPETPSGKNVILDEEELQSLSASIANARAYITQALGDVAATVKYTQRALDLIPENEYFERGLSAILQGFAYWSSGNLEAAYRAISDAISNMRMIGKIRFMISFTSYLADVMIAQGRLNEAKKTYFQLLEIAEEQGKPEINETAVLHLGLSELYHEQGDLESARWHLLRSEELGELPAFPPWYRHWVLSRVRIKEAEGDLDGVIKILNEADRLYYRHPIPDVRPLTALIARALLAEGRLPKALLWASERGLSVDDDLTYLREFDHLTLARILLAQYRRDQVTGLIHDTIGLLERLLNAAERGNRMGSVIEILVLQALAYEAQGKFSPAHISLERALELAEPEGYMRTFVAEGAPMKALLKMKTTEDARLKEYIAKLLDAFGESDILPPADQALIEPLSEREIEVLQLIAEGLTNPEIASRLYLSLNTVKVHTRNIYGKLNVHSRIQAAARAQELGLLPPRSN